jgi:ribosomal protein S12 methylthiotransferase accessory factor
MELIVTLGEKAKVNAEFKGYTICTDQPLPNGDGSAPTPFDLFLASLGTCAGIFVKGFCQQRGIDDQGIKIIQTFDFDREKHLVKHITIEIKLPVGFPEKYKDAVVNVADLCLVKRHLADPPVIETFATIG